MEVGDVVGGRYCVLRARAIGSCGRVFEADDRELTDEYGMRTSRVVLLQELDAMVSAESVAALETLAARARTSPSLVSIRHVLVEGSSLVLVYEPPRPGDAFARAESLTELARRAGSPLPGDLANAVITAMFAALSSIHRAGDVHGALSPRNVVVWRADVCSLLGAGLAHPSEALGVGGQRDLFVYAAPEILRREVPTMVADVFAVAAIAHHLLCGRVPSEGRNALETLHDRGNVAAKPISTWTGRQDAALDAFFARALALDATRRFPDATALLEAWTARVSAASPTQADEEPHFAKLVATSVIAQREILRVASQWLDQGGTLFPTELVVSLATELSDRLDRELVEAAWDDDEEAPVSRARIFVGDAHGDVVDSIDALPCAREDLRALVADARRDVLAMLARVAVDHAPRGVEGVGDSRSHLRVRVGPHRLLYCVRGGLVVLTHIMQGFDLVAQRAVKPSA